MPKKNVIILIHGIGKHEAGWANNLEDGPVPTLKKAAATYEDIFPTDNPIQASVEFVEVAYDQIFETVRNQWHSLFSNLSQAKFDGASASSVESLQKLMPDAINELSEATEESKWAATHALDALLYKGFALVRNIVRYSVASQLAKIVADRVQDDRDEDPEYIIVAHSLGTAVLHDSLNLLGGTNWLNGVEKLQSEGMAESIDKKRLEFVKDRFGSNIFSSQGGLRWRGVVMISNVSAILCRRPTPGAIDTRVRPRHSGGMNGRVVEYFINVDHLFDPIAKLRPFRAESTWPGASALRYAEDVVNLRHFYDRNVHSLSHYLLHPRVHARIFWLAIRRRFPWSRVVQAEADMGDHFPRFAPGFVDDVKRLTLEKALADVLTITERKEVEAYRERVQTLGEIISEFDNG